MKHELQSIISGKSQVEHGAIIQAITCYISQSKSAGEVAQNYKHFRKEETECLEQFISKNNLWIKDINLKNYVSEGSEQKVYLKDNRSVIKLNDAIFYNSWIDYFNNLLLNNYFFPDTAYKLIGFYKEGATVYAGVEQSFIEATEKTDLHFVKEFMISNGFQNTRNNDYFHPDLGIILEDLHDENVLTKKGVLFFIDTVFYITDEFYK